MHCTCDIHVHVHVTVHVHECVPWRIGVFCVTLFASTVTSTLLLNTTAFTWSLIWGLVARHVYKPLSPALTSDMTNLMRKIHMRGMERRERRKRGRRGERKCMMQTNACGSARTIFVTCTCTTWKHLLVIHNLIGRERNVCTCTWIHQEPQLPRAWTAFTITCNTQCYEHVQCICCIHVHSYMYITSK